MRDVVEIQLFGKFHFGEYKNSRNYILVLFSPEDSADFEKWHNSKEVIDKIKGRVLMPHNDGEEFILIDARCLNVGTLEASIIFKSIECG